MTSTLCDTYDKDARYMAAKAENEKLRELVCMMLTAAGVAEYATDIEWQTITHYLRELGIEVQ